MLLVAAFVFTYYTIWALLTVSAILAGLHPSDLVLLTLDAAFLTAVLLVKLTDTRLLPRSRLGSANTGIPSGGRVSWDWRVRWQRHAERGGQEEGQGSASSMTSRIYGRRACQAPCSIPSLLA